MKYLKIPLFAVTLILLTFSCEKNQPKARFSLSYETEVVLRSNELINVPVNLYSPEVETNSESSFAVNDTRKDKVEEIYLSLCILEIEAPEQQNFDFLREIEIFINAEGEEELRLAYKENVTSNSGRRLVLDLSNRDFQEYIKKEEFTMRVRTVMKNRPSQDVYMTVHTDYEVVARILGS